MIKAQQTLKENGLRITPLRQTLVNYLQENHGPFLASELIDNISEVNFDRATLFRNLETLSQKDIIKKVFIPGHSTRYEINDHHHHHLSCNSCHKIIPIHDCGLKDFEKKLEKKLGIKIHTHQLEFTGLCKDCS